MLGRLTKSLLCIGAITALASERDPGAEMAGLVASARHAAIAQVQSACIADPARCVEALRIVGSADLPARASRDTLTAADRAAQPRRQGG